MGLGLVVDGNAAGREDGRGALLARWCSDGGGGGRVLDAGSWGRGRAQEGDGRHWGLLVQGNDVGALGQRNRGLGDPWRGSTACASSGRRGSIPGQSGVGHPWRQSTWEGGGLERGKNEEEDGRRRQEGQATEASGGCRGSGSSIQIEAGRSYALDWLGTKAE